MPSSSPDWPALLALAVSQGAYFSTAQAAALGFSPELLIHHVHAGRLVRARRGVYRVDHLPPSDDEDLVVLWLWSGGRGVFSHRTALALHGLSDILPSGVDLTLPAAAARSRLRVPDGLRLHYADLAPAERVWIGHVPVTAALRTLADCSALPLEPDLMQQAMRDAATLGLVGRDDLERLQTRTPQ